MLTKDLLLRLHLCKHIGIKGETSVWHWLQQHPMMWQETVLSVTDIIDIARISKRRQPGFIEDFLSAQLDQRMKDNLAYAGVLTILDSRYPPLLKETYSPPIVLFYQGNLELLETPMLGIVGARSHTDYAIHSLQLVLPKTVEAGITIVSGLAAGIDTLGHQGALAFGGHTIAVIGTGLDQYYPKVNSALQQEIALDHLLLTEYPIGSVGARHHFPERNRIIAGLVQTLMVVEARSKSGSLITANLALQENRNVLAIPGPITAVTSSGTNDLIAAGAKPVLNAKHIIEEF